MLSALPQSNLITILLVAAGLLIIYLIFKQVQQLQMQVSLQKNQIRQLKHQIVHGVITNDSLARISYTPLLENHYAPFPIEMDECSSYPNEQLEELEELEDGKELNEDSPYIQEEGAPTQEDPTPIQEAATQEATQEATKEEGAPTQEVAESAVQKLVEPTESVSESLILEEPISVQEEPVKSGSGSESDSDGESSELSASPPSPDPYQNSDMVEDDSDEMLVSEISEDDLSIPGNPIGIATAFLTSAMLADSESRKTRVLFTTSSDQKTEPPKPKLRLTIRGNN